MEIKFTTYNSENFNISSMEDYEVVGFPASLEMKEKFISETGGVIYCCIEMREGSQCTTTYAGEIPELENALEKIGFEPSLYNSTIYCCPFSYETPEEKALFYIKESLKECGWFVDLI